MSGSDCQNDRQRCLLFGRMSLPPPVLLPWTRRQAVCALKRGRCTSSVKAQLSGDVDLFRRNTAGHTACGPSGATGGAAQAAEGRKEGRLNACGARVFFEEENRPGACRTCKGRRAPDVRAEGHPASLCSTLMPRARSSSTSRAARAGRACPHTGESPSSMV